MDDKKIEQLITITESEALCIESYMCLKEESVEGPYGRWGWNTSLKNISDHFAYIFSLTTIIQYNERKKINKISNDMVMELINGRNTESSEWTGIEKTFYSMWKETVGLEDFHKLEKHSKKLCKYLTSLGYEMNFILYKNPRKALSKALELDQYLPEGEMGFGEFLRANLNDEYE